MSNLGLFIGGTEITSFTPCEIVTEREKRSEEMEYYMNRKGKYYFRGKCGKMVVETTDDLVKIGDLKRGQILTMNFEL